ncbi:MAG: hypothetical protein ACFCVH_22635 [Alphaproteobacteria bacterium]
MTGGLAIVDNGAFYLHRGLYEPPFAEVFDAVLYLPELSGADFDRRRHAAIVVACRTPPELLVPHAVAIRAFLDAGGMLVAMGETGAHHWLPGVAWVDAPVNFWWWIEGGDSGVRPAAPDHSLWRHLPPQDVVWHYHGVFTPPQGAVSVIDHAGGGSLFYDDRVSSGGRMIVSALDPFYHYGSHFMPATTRFLSGFLPWLQAEIAAG